MADSEDDTSTRLLQDTASFDEAEAEVSDEESDRFAISSSDASSELSLPDTVTVLHTDDGATVYVVGTAHFSMDSQEDVAKTISMTQPDVLVLELCSARVTILTLDEETLLKEAKSIGIDKMRDCVRKYGVVQAVLHLLLLGMSAHITEQLGMAPGGEFRRAVSEVRKFPNCQIILGDRPIDVTFKRVLQALTLWQKIKLTWCMLTMKDPISKEDVERCKQRDLLEQMLEEMTGEFPAMSQVFLTERDLYLAHQLHQATVFRNDHTKQGPRVVVGVVGMGHVAGIAENWMKPVNIPALMKVPKQGFLSLGIKWMFRGSIVGLLAWGSYRICKYLKPGIS